MQFIKEQKGSALIYVLISAVLMTSTLLVILNYYHLQQRLVSRKGHLLQAKYSAEGALYQFLQEIEEKQDFSPLKKSNESVITISSEDSARIQSICWGGFLFLASVTNNRGENFYLEALAGTHPSAAFNPAIMVSPNSGPLILSGRSRVEGDVVMGSGGIRKVQLREQEDNRDIPVHGSIIETSQDLRPEIDRNYLENIWEIFREVIESEDLLTFPEILQDTSRYISADSAGNWWEQPIYVTNEQLNQNNWHLRGPLILIADGPLLLKNNLIMEHFVQIFSSHTIEVQGQGSTFHEVLFYSPKKIILSGADNFCGQIFSDQEILIQDRSRLHYPTLLTVKSKSDSGLIRINASCTAAGSIILVSENYPFVGAQNQSKIFIEEGAVVDGLVWSDNYTQLQGEVNGLVITNQFYEYDPPTLYRNWIKNGIVRRKKLNRRFCLPLFFKQTGSYLTVLDIQ